MNRVGKRVRSSIRTSHVIVSVAWIGSVLAFFIVAVLGWSSADTRIEAGVYAALQATMWIVIVPLAVLSLASGIVVSLITRWGLAKHYWVLVKLVLTTGATLLLLVHTRAVDNAAEAALAMHGRASALRLQLVVDSAAALGVLAAITVLAYVKPRGTTPWADTSLRRA